MDARDITLIALGIAGFIANTFLLCSICKKKSRMTVFHVTLLSLGLSDLLTSIMILSFGVTGELNLNHNKDVQTFLWSGGLSTQLISFLHLLFIAMQRLIAILHPMKFRLYFTISRSVITLVILWALTAVFCILLAAVIQPNLLFMTVCIFTSGGVLILLYSAICWQIKKKRKLAPHASTREAKDHSTQKVRLHSFIVMIVFIICTFPYAFSVIYPFGRVGSLVTDVLFALNAFLDPLVYFLIKYYRQNIVTNRSTINSRVTAAELKNIQND